MTPYCFRKLKNRAAAQSARDRKKERMDQLESIVGQLEVEVLIIIILCDNRPYPTSIIRDPMSVLLKNFLQEAHY